MSTKPFVEKAESEDLASVLLAFPTKLVDHLCVASRCTGCIVIVHIASCPALDLFKCLYISLSIRVPHRSCILQDWSNNRSISSCFDLSGAVLKFPSQESQGAVGFAGCIGDVLGP